MCDYMRTEQATDCVYELRATSYHIIVLVSNTMKRDQQLPPSKLFTLNLISIDNSRKALRATVWPPERKNLSRMIDGP